jgi:hypothetical protein
MLRGEFVCTRSNMKTLCMRDKQAYVNERFAKRYEVRLLFAFSSIRYVLCS